MLPFVAQYQPSMQTLNSSCKIGLYYLTDPKGAEFQKDDRTVKQAIL